MGQLANFFEGISAKLPDSLVAQGLSTFEAISAYLISFVSLTYDYSTLHIVNT
jgi:hypothetical protein